MPATFQKTNDKTLEGIHSKFAFLDDILIITRGSLNDHEQEIDKILNLLDKKKPLNKTTLKKRICKDKLSLAWIQNTS